MASAYNRLYQHFFPFSIHLIDCFIKFYKVTLIFDKVFWKYEVVGGWWDQIIPPLSLQKTTLKYPSLISVNSEQLI